MPQPQPCSTCDDRGWIILAITADERARRVTRLQQALGHYPSDGLISTVGRIAECPVQCPVAKQLARVLYRSVVTFDDRPIETAA